MSSNTGHTKEQIAKHLRTLADNLAKGSTPNQISVSLEVMAAWLDLEHKQEEHQDTLANRGTVECPMCHGMRICFDGDGQSPELISHVQCPQCLGWGRETPPS